MGEGSFSCGCDTASNEMTMIKNRDRNLEGLVQ